MPFSLCRDLAAEVHPVYAAAYATATAAGTGDNTATEGASIDPAALPCRFESVAFLLAATATLAATKTLTVSAKIEHYVDGAWADLVAATTVLTLTGAAGGSTETGAGKIGVSLEYAEGPVRVSFTPNLSATATDTAAVQVLAVFGGAERMPVA